MTTMMMIMMLMMMMIMIMMIMMMVVVVAMMMISMMTMTMMMMMMMMMMMVMTMVIMVVVVVMVMVVMTMTMMMMMMMMVMLVMVMMMVMMVVIVVVIVMVVVVVMMMMMMVMVMVVVVVAMTTMMMVMVMVMMMMMPSLSAATLTPCQRDFMRSLAMRKRRPIGFFFPVCEADGSFRSLQCHAATGFCWCVDRRGSEITGTRQWGELNCTARMEGNMLLLWPYPHNSLCFYWVTLFSLSREHVNVHTGCGRSWRPYLVFVVFVEMILTPMLILRRSVLA